MIYLSGSLVRQQALGLVPAGSWNQERFRDSLTPLPSCVFPLTHLLQISASLHFVYLERYVSWPGASWVHMIGLWLAALIPGPQGQLSLR